MDDLPSHSEKLRSQLFKIRRKQNRNTPSKTESPFKNNVKKYWKTVMVILVPLLLMALPIIGFNKAAEGVRTENMKLKKMGTVYAAAYILMVMVIFWITSLIPLSVTSMIPIFALPMFGVMDSETVVTFYFQDSILIFVGGLMLALAFEFSNLHNRVALRVILCTGTSIKRLLLGIVVTTSFLSMWMSNTAVAALMVPIVSAVMDELGKCVNESLAKEFEEALELQQERLGNNPDNQNQIVQFEGTGSSSDQKITMVEESGSDLLPHQSSITSLPPIKKSASSDTLGSQSSITSSLANVLNDMEQARVERELSMLHYLKNIKIMFMISIAYSSNIGGTGVLTGSGTNFVAFDHLDEAHLPEHLHGHKAQLTFLSWLSFCLPPMLVNLTFAYFFALFWFTWWKKGNKCCCGKKKGNKCCCKKGKDRRKSNVLKMDAIQKLQKEFTITPAIAKQINGKLLNTYKKLGKLTCHETGVICVFSFTVLLWVFHDPKIFPGWGCLFAQKFEKDTLKCKNIYPTLTTTAIIAGIALFIIPRNREFYRAFLKFDFRHVKFQPLMEWQYVHQKLPWGVILLLGGGFAVSKGVEVSGLGAQIGCGLKELASLPRTSFLAIVCFGVSFFTEVASNTAVASILIPILRDLSLHACWHPLYLTMPATVACSHAFMLPVATPPNAIVFAASNMKLGDMLKPGLIMNMVTTLVLYLFTMSWGLVVFDFNNYDKVPDRCEALKDVISSDNC